MRIYYPINEFDDVGYIALPLSIFLSEKLILWCPMPMYIDQMYNSGKSILNSQDILSLVEEGYIQIACRENWLDANYRNSISFSNAKYTYFDTKLKTLMNNSCGKMDAPIYIAPNQQGGSYAKKIIKNNTNKSNKILIATEELLNNFSQIPTGIQDKLLGKTNEQRKELLIRILRNNFNGLKETCSDNIIYFDQFYDKAAFIAGFNPSKTNKYDYTDVYTFIQMCDYLCSMTEIKDRKTFMRQLKKRDTSLVKNEISKILKSSLSVEETYLQWYEDMIMELEKRNKTFIKKILIDSCTTLPGALVLLMDIILNTDNQYFINMSLSDIVVNTATVASTGRFAYDTIKQISRTNEKRPLLPFLGAKKVGEVSKKEYLDALERTKRRIY